MKKNITAYLVTLIIFLLIHLCCKEKINEPELISGDLLPLAIGNYWSYVQYAIGFPGLTDSAKVVITGFIDIEFENQIYKAGIWTNYPQQSAGPLDYQWLYWNGPDGLYKMGGISGTDTMITKIFYLKCPSINGENWRVPELAYDLNGNNFIITGDTITYTCVSTNESFITSVGTFQCYKYHWREKFDDIIEYWDHYIYYSPNIGWVGKIIKSSLDNSTKYKIEMYEFQTH